MGIALLALSGLFKNLSSSRSTPPATAKRHFGRIHPVWAARPAACLPQAPHGARPQPKTQSLRVLRIQDSDHRAECAGRMVISGRMADVCAELDRLVALEAQGQRC